MSAFRTIMIIITVIVLLYCLYLLLTKSKKQTNKQTVLPVVEEVDLQRYQGVWYEIARTPNPFETNCTQAIAIYTLNDDNTVTVENRCIIDNEINNFTTIKGIATANDSQLVPGTTILRPGKLKVSFNGAPTGNYYILALDPNYQYALIGEPNRKYLWILSRQPNSINQTVYNMLISKAQSLGFPTDKIIINNISLD